jgi:hypothetical protein
MVQSKKSKATEQLNLRIPTDLINDLEKISQILKVNKSEWIKIKLSELVHSEKSKIIDQYVELNKRGLIDKKEIDELLK